MLHKRYICQYIYISLACIESYQGCGDSPVNQNRTFILSAAAAAAAASLPEEEEEDPLFGAGLPEEEEANLVWPLLVELFIRKDLASRDIALETKDVYARDPFSTHDITPLLSFERLPARDTESLSTIFPRHPDRLIGYI